MANYYAKARSNYFRVKDRRAFNLWACERNLEAWEQGDTGLVAIRPDDYEEGGWPSMMLNEKTDEYDDVDIPAELSEHLVEGEVAILMEVGWEKLRYLTGHAIAVNAAGDIEHISLHNAIMDKAKTMGTAVTEPLY